MLAFVYCWTDHKTSKLYVGSHKGRVDDGYVCSSKHMKEEYNKRPADFSRQIVAIGDVDSMRKLEAAILKSVKAKTNESFYNKHENDKLFFDGWAKGTMSASHRANISAAKRGKKISKEHAEKLHAGRKNSKNSAEHNAKIREAQLGSTHTDDTKKKMSDAKKNDPNIKELCSYAGQISVQKRPANYRELQSARIKMWWASRKKQLGDQN